MNKEKYSCYNSCYCNDVPMFYRYYAGKCSNNCGKEGRCKY